MICWVCGKEYDTDAIPRIHITAPNGKQLTVKSVNLKGKEVPLCSECLRMYLLTQYGRDENWDIDFNF